MDKSYEAKLRQLGRSHWTDQDQQDFEAELDGSSDRAAVLIAAAYVESTLEFVLRMAMPNQPSKGDNVILFGPSGALSSFAAKTRLAYLLGVFGPITKEDLLSVISVRNKFAHTAKHITFSDQDIKIVCAKFKAHYAYIKEGFAEPFVEGFENIPERIKFLSTCLDIEGALRIRSAHILRLRNLDMRRDFAAIEERQKLGKSIKVLAMKHIGLP